MIFCEEYIEILMQVKRNTEIWMKGEIMESKARRRKNILRKWKLWRLTMAMKIYSINGSEKLYDMKYG